MIPTPLVALAAGVLAGLGIVTVLIAFSPKPAPKQERQGKRGIERSRTPALLGSIIVGFVVLVITGWLLAALAVGVLVYGWRWLFVIDDALSERYKVQAIAKWLEDLRDIIRRSSVPPEEALELTAEDSVGVLSVPFSRFVLRRRQGVPLPEALAELADTIDHPTADAAIASIMLVIGGGAGGARLYDTVDELADAARNEGLRRDEIDRLRRTYQRAMRRLIVIVAVFIVGLLVLAPSLLEPYSEPLGQLWLFIPISIWTACLVYMRRLTRYDLGSRYRLRLPSENHR